MLSKKEAFNLTGISPLHGSHVALPIACDALNARAVAVREYHYIFLHIVARKLLHLLWVVVCFCVVLGEWLWYNEQGDFTIRGHNI